MTRAKYKLMSLSYRFKIAKTKFNITSPLPQCTYYIFPPQSIDVGLMFSGILYDQLPKDKVKLSEVKFLVLHWLPR